MASILLRPTFIVSLLAALLIGNNTAEQHEEKNTCLLPRDRGDPTSCGAKTAVLGASVLRFYYDRATQHCQPFTYLGCGGNGNKFETLTACKTACSGAGSGSDAAEGHDGHAKVVSVPKCNGGVRVAVNEASQPVDCSACPNGYECQSSQKQCCPTREHTCSLEYDTGKYVSQGSHTPRYFYNKAVNNCLLFTYYGALGNANNFETYNECVSFCGAKSNKTVAA